VVNVRYLPSRISFADLVKRAQANSCTTKIFTTTEVQLQIAREAVGDDAEPLVGEPRVSKESDQLYFLKRSHLRYLPLSPLQARRVNGALGSKQDPGRWLSPRQTQLGILAKKTLEKDAECLSDLQRPTELLELAKYGTRLVQALSQSE
jgi:hypothetical protein